MNKRLVGLVIVSLSFIFFVSTGCGGDSFVWKTKGKKKGYLGFKTLDSAFDITFEYPENCEIDAYSESVEETIYFIGLSKREESGKYQELQWGLTISKEKPKKFKAIDEKADNWLNLVRKDLKAKVHFDKNITLGGAKARHYSYSYLEKGRTVRVGGMPPPSNQPPPYWTRSEWIVAKKGGYFYEINFDVKEKDYEKYKEIIDHCQAQLEMSAF